MTVWRVILVAVGAVLVFGMSNLTILQKQEIVDNGRKVLLRLAPVDPRSLIQGDFMRLRYDRASYPDARTQESLPWRGTVVLALDDLGVGEFARTDDGTALAPGEVRIGYKLSGRGGTMRFGADSFFFQEGDADLYANADFGVLHVDDEGGSVLVGLAGEDGALIVSD